MRRLLPLKKTQKKAGSGCDMVRRRSRRAEWAVEGEGKGRGVGEREREQKREGEERERIGDVHKCSVVAADALRPKGCTLANDAALRAQTVNVHTIFFNINYTVMAECIGRRPGVSILHCVRCRTLLRIYSTLKRGEKRVKTNNT